METMNEKNSECLTYRRGADTATVTTDGVTHTTLERTDAGGHMELETRNHRSVGAACAYLAARGYDIDTEYCINIKTWKEWKESNPR